MTIADELNKIAVAQGGTASDDGISGAIDALNDALAGSDQEAAQSIEGAIALLGQHIGGGSTPTGTIEITENGEGIDVAQYAYADVSVSGGSSDFSTATVTLNITPPEGVTGIDEYVMAGLSFPDDEITYSGTFVCENSETEILLYDGYGIITAIQSHKVADYELDPETITTTGNVVYQSDENLFIVTGDCTISGTYVEGGK